MLGGRFANLFALAGRRIIDACSTRLAANHGPNVHFGLRFFSRLTTPAAALSGNSSFSSSLLRVLPLWSPSAETSGSRTMATLHQMHRSGPLMKKRAKAKPTDGRPQLKGVVLRTLIRKPKKPNSANRKCVRVKLSTGREATAYVPNVGHNLQEHSIVLVRAGKVRDLPGVKLKCVRGKFDLGHVVKKN